MTTFQDARAIVRQRFAHVWEDAGEPYAVADYGSEDARAFYVPHGHPEVLAGTRTVDDGMAQVATFVDKASGEPYLEPYLAPGVLDRLAKMDRVGTWPPED